LLEDKLMMSILLQVQNEPGLFKNFHYFTSFLFVIIAVWLMVRVYKGLVKDQPYKQIDKILSFAFIINMYLQLIIGLVLFSNISAFYSMGSENAVMVQEAASKRFWPVEHIVLMIFALFIANLGLIFSIKSSNDKLKFKRIFVYYLISILLIAISLGGIYFL